MASSNSHLDLLTSSQSAKEIWANMLFDASSPAMLYGRRGLSTAGLTFGYYGGNLMIGDTPTPIANGIVTLTASATNYVEADPADGTVSVNITGFTSGAIQLYEIVTGAATVTSYTDKRCGGAGASGVGSGDVTGPASSTDNNFAIFNGASGKVIEDSGVSLDTDDTLAANSDTKIPSQQAVKAYVAAQMAGAGTGDVIGPSSAGNNRVAFFDGTSGKLIKDSGLTLSGTNTGDQTSVTGNAGTATALQTARTIGGVSFDGTSNIAQPFDMHMFRPGVPGASAKIYRGKIARAVSFPANFSGSQFTATANATASTVFDIQKNGSSVGSCTIAAGGTAATFASSGSAAVSFAAGDVLAIIAPSSADATLADPAFTLIGTR